MVDVGVMDVSVGGQLGLFFASEERTEEDAADGWSEYYRTKELTAGRWKIKGIMQMVKQLELSGGFRGSSVTG